MPSVRSAELCLAAAVIKPGSAVKEIAMNKMQTVFCGAAMMILALPGLVASASAEPMPGMNSSSGIIALNSLPNPAVTLATASVTDAKGMAVGFV